MGISSYLETAAARSQHGLRMNSEILLVGSYQERSLKLHNCSKQLVIDAAG